MHFLRNRQFGKGHRYREKLKRARSFMKSSKERGDVDLSVDIRMKKIR